MPLVMHAVSPSVVTLRPEPMQAGADTRTEIVPGIADAIDRFMAALGNQNLSWETIRKYRGLLKRRLLSWCEEEGYSAVSALTVTRLDDFRQTWQDGPLYATKNLERLRAFFQFCVDRDWIEKNSAKAVKAPQVDVVPTLPYTADEMTRILAACDRYRGDKDRIRAFILVMRYAGLRISDTIKLHADQRIEHRLRLYTTKTGQPVYVPLPPFVVEALEKIERPGHRYFWTGRAKLSTGRANWSRYLASVFRLAKVERTAGAIVSAIRSDVVAGTGRFSRDSCHAAVR
jgi:site-specific recombinase XerD